MRSRAAAGASALALAVACAAAGVLTLMFAGDARATYPGADGRVAFMAAADCPRYSAALDPCEQSFSAVMAVSPLGAARPLARCPGPQCVGSLGERGVWSPDGRLLAAALARDGLPPGVAIFDASGALVRVLPAPVAGAEPVAWLPGGRSVAVLSDTHVFALPLAGGPARAIRPPNGPRTWSARGDVALVTPAGISVRRPGGRRRLLRRAGDRVAYGIPDWSPDGRRLAVVRTDRRSSLSTLLEVPARGGRSQVVVRGEANCPLGDPVWSPSGERLAFAAPCLDGYDDVTPSVYVVRRDGSRLRRIFAPARLSSPPGALEPYISAAVSWQARP